MGALRVRLFTLLALCFAALCSARNAHAQRYRRHERVYYGVLFPRPTYIDRPLTVGRRHIDLEAGVGFEYGDYFRERPFPNNVPLSGAGTHADILFGVLDSLEISAGLGARFNDDARLLGADRLARVNREWLPYNGLYPYATWRNASALGNDWFTNPYVRLRVAFVNRPPVLVGLEVWHNLPFARYSPFAVGVGLPLHFVVGHRVRFETGIFTELLVNRDVDTYPIQIPFRVNFQVTDRFWLGIRSGLEMVGYRNPGSNVTSPLGFQGGVRVIERLDIVWQAVFPDFFHPDPYNTNELVLTRSFGLGIGVIARLL